MVIISKISKYLTAYTDFLCFVFGLICKIFRTQITFSVPLIYLFIKVQQLILTKPPFQTAVLRFIEAAVFHSHLLHQPVKFMCAVKRAYRIIGIRLRHLFKRCIQIVQCLEFQSQFFCNIRPVHETRAFRQNFIIFRISATGGETTSNGIIMVISRLIYKLIYRIYFKCNLRISFMKLIQRIAYLGIRKILIPARADNVRHISGSHHQ